MGYEWTTVFLDCFEQVHRKWSVATEENESLTSFEFHQTNLLFSTFGKLEKSKASAY